MKTLVAIDPGDFAGVAIFSDGRLSQVEFVVYAVDRGWTWEGQTQVPVVCEVPESYTGSRVKIQNLLTLSFTAGYLVGQFKPSKLTKVLPKEWKGQRPKKVDNAYTLRLLCDQERHILNQSGIPSSQLHNVLDAVGIGLWALERR